ncbi:TAXI family TRAP transporter solute-binding subunit [Roseiterribacter gracilis]|uniref:C4-dicarboxylate ABC transporter substrate-binding protein n=1 Tax=Roseiterribacter gracilis TaxID=2812848 RepID=A0A8S8XAZ4_9PROT|nr:C4-dicarboxylate ABC transporter substrate-binding protein [Rhodospirillales bacterium TMPK1]
MKFQVRRAAALAAVSLAIGAAAPAPRTLVVGSGAVAGYAYPVAGAICRAANATRDKSGIRCAVESTDGSVANLQRLATGDLDLAIVQSDWQRQFVTGTGKFQSAKPDTELRALLSLYPEVLAIVVRADSGIAGAEDLRGKKVVIGEPKQPANPLFGDLLVAIDLDRKEFAQTIEMPLADQPKSLCDKRVDAVVTVVAHPSMFLQQIAASCPIKLLEFKGEAIDQMLRTRPHLAAATLPPNAYPGQAEPVASFGIRATLVTRSSLPDEAAEGIVASVLAELDGIKRQHPVFAGIDRSQLGTAALSAPLHPGARKVLEKAGIAVPPPATAEPPSPTR